MKMTDAGSRITLSGFKMARRWTRPASITVHGFYGAHNVGDDAILDATLDTIRRLGREPHVAAWNPGVVARTRAVRAVNARASTLQFSRSLLDTEAFLLGGGGLIKDYGSSSASVSQWMRGLSLAADLGIPTMTWSVGVEALRFPDSVRRVRETLERVTLVTVRDEESAERLRDIGLRREIAVTADPVPAYVAARRSPRPRNERPLIAVALRHWFVASNDLVDEAAFDRFLDALADALGTLAHRLGAEIAFVPFRTSAGDDDRRVGERVTERVRAHYPDTRPPLAFDDPDPSVEATLDRLNRADVVISMRLHAAVIAATLGVPTIALSYAPKVGSFMKQIGMTDYCHAIGDITSGWVQERVCQALDLRAELRDRLLVATNSLAEKYAVNEQLLETVLPPRHG